MKRFVFALQPVLDHRQRCEDEKQQTLAVRQVAHDEAARELHRLDTAFRDGANLLRAEHASFDADSLRMHYGHLQFLDRAIVAQIRVVAERRVALDRARDELLSARKERRVVEKLKDRRRTAFLTEESRIEQNELDDGNSRMYGRRLGQTGGLS